MTTSTPVSTPTIKSKEPRPVTLAHTGPRDGRLPVTITVTPIADLDVSGVFVDFRLGHLESKGGGSEKRTTPLTRGDAAVSALAASEASDILAEASEADQHDGAHVAADGDKPEGKRPVVSHQIGKPMKLKVGQSESVRAEVAVPTAPTDDQVWFMRGRFATADGEDLNSSWQKV